MNMRRIVFAAAAILIMLLIIFWMLHSMAHIDEINQNRREKEKGEAAASQMITTTATTSIWDALRSQETEAPQESGEPAPENPEEETSAEYEENIPDYETQPGNQTMTETYNGFVVIPIE